MNSPDDCYSTESKSQVIWLHGNPGQGKSTMATYIIETLSTCISADAKRYLSYFLCDSNYAIRTSSKSILRGLLWQLWNSYPRLIPGYARRHYDQLKQKLFDDFDHLWTLFMETAKANDSCQLYCIIDALDECDEASRDDLLYQIEHVFSGSARTPPNINFLILSRPYVQIRDYLSQFDNHTIASFPQLQRDIDLYIDHEVEKLAKIRRYPRVLKEKLKRELGTRAEETFLWVGLACRELRRIPSVNALEFLERLPRQLESIYSQMFDSILGPDAPDAADTTKILSFVATAVRPLTLLELSEACAFDTNEDDVEARTQYLRDRIESCRLVIDIVTVRNRDFLDGLQDWSDSDDSTSEALLESERVVLLHQTVKDYLFTSRREQLNGGEQHSHAIMAYRCLDQIINCMPERGLAGYGNFLRYSIAYWPQHARLAQSSFQVQGKHASFFLDPSPVRDEWLAQRNDAHVFGIWRSAKHSLPLLNVAALWGIPSLVDYISRRSSRGVTFNVKLDDEERKGCSTKSPLTDAVEGGCVYTFQKLLRFGLPLTELAIESAWTFEREAIKRAILQTRRHEIVQQADLQKSAAKVFNAGEMRILMDHPDFTISQSTLHGAMANEKHGLEVLELIVAQSGVDPKILLQRTITESTTASVEFLIDRFSLNLNGEQSLIAKAAENWESGASIINLLFRRFPDIEITDDVILAIVKLGDFSEQHISGILKIIFDELGPKFQITNRVLLGAARAEMPDEDFGDVFKIVLQHASEELAITHEVVMSVAQNPNAWATMPLLLSSREAEICITEDILCAAIPNMENSYSALLCNAAKHSIKITEKAIAAAARESDREGFLQVLNAADANSRITQDVLLAAAANDGKNGVQIMWLLLHESMNADEIGNELVDEVLLGDKCDIMSVILKRRGARIRLSKGLVQGWISNERTQGRALKFLLQYKSAELNSILGAMSADEQAEFVERRDRLFTRFERDSWEDIFKRRGE
ncbi:vegetative incompatibility protein HET-E-1 [Purpureocillium lilacinum]|uniref:Vegetative incompatibility protein HET-E-1 n=1 Tax=Purpureocillium lilacinum TaxID=33203 RepID=A0A179FJ55_PURLI|nr:vegetative incompatibility protein HET-E-1 [Purpureocillium lilacinum]